jgi:single-strand DNA-binding protein
MSYTREIKMQDINVVILTGGLTKDVTIRNTQNGYFYSFSLGFNKSEKDRQGNWKEKSLYRDCTFYSKSQFYGNTLKKGTKVCVKGLLDTDEWTDQQGQTKKKDFIRVEELQILSKKAQQKQDDGWNDNFSFPDEAPTF